MKIMTCSSPYGYPATIPLDVKTKSLVEAGGLLRTKSLDIFDTSSSELEIPMKLSKRSYRFYYRLTYK